MAKKPETRLQQSIQYALNREVGGWWFKVWGGPFMPAGIPDLIGCVNGMFFAFEVKLPKASSKPSMIQLETIRDIVMKGGGVATIVRSPEEAVQIVYQTLARATRRSRVRPIGSKRRVILRAAHGENLRQYRNDRGAGERRPLPRSGSEFAEQPRLNVDGENYRADPPG